MTVSLLPQYTVALSLSVQLYSSFTAGREPGILSCKECTFSDVLAYQVAGNKIRLHYFSTLSYYIC